MQVLFVIGLEDTLAAVDSGFGPNTQRVGLQDDNTYVGPASEFLAGYPTLKSQLEKAGHRLVPHKCSMWAPGWQDIQTRDMPEPFKQLAAILPRSTHGVDLLGSAADGMYRATIRGHPTRAE